MNRLINNSEYDQKQDKESLKQAENCYSHSIQAAKRSDPINLTGALVNYALVQEEQHQVDKAEITFKYSFFAVKILFCGIISLLSLSCRRSCG